MSVSMYVNPKSTVHKIYLSYIAKCCFLDIFFTSLFVDVQISKYFGSKLKNRVENGENCVGFSEVFERAEDPSEFR